MNIFDLAFISPSGKEIRMSDFRGKVILIANTATRCGFTPQLEALQILHEKYSRQGLVVIGFPCNQFGRQEPVANEDLETYCSTHHAVSFQLSEKVDVNGSKAHPIFVFLKKSLGTWLGSSIKWNFTKFLLDRDGKPVKRLSPRLSPMKLESRIQELLKG